jgi:hypothetical protein
LHIDSLNEKVAGLLKDKERIMREYKSDIEMRDSEIEEQRIRHKEDLQRKENEKD